MFAKARLADLLAPGEDRTGFLLRFTISHPGVHTVIVGTKNPDHLAGNVKAIQAGKLPLDVYEEAKRRLSQAGENPEPASRPTPAPVARTAPAPVAAAKPAAKPAPVKKEATKAPARKAAK
jgi:hypothetical protein